MANKWYDVGDKDFSGDETTELLRNAIFNIHNGLSVDQVQKLLEVFLTFSGNRQSAPDPTQAPAQASSRNRHALSETAQRILDEETVGLWEQGDRWRTIITEKVLVIVCGQWECAEIFDRHHAFRISDVVQESSRRYDPLVVNDAWWWQIQSQYPFRPVITVGGPHVNTLSNSLKDRKELGNFAVGLSQIEGRRVGYLWGHDVASTFLACDRFLNDGHLQNMLET